jgi:hypothetical protein
MTVHKDMKLKAGLKTWVTPVSVSAGAGDADKSVVLNADGKLDVTLLPGGLANTIVALASENLAAGDAVNLWDDAGTAKLRKADADTISKKCDGFVIASVTSGASATAYKDGSVTGLSGLTVGADYFLSTTAGGITTDPSGYTTSGQTVQHVGNR